MKPEQNNEALAPQCNVGPGSNIPQITDTNVFGTGSVKIRKTRREIAVDVVRIVFLQYTCAWTVSKSSVNCSLYSSRRSVSRRGICQTPPRKMPLILYRVVRKIAGTVYCI